MPTPLIHYLAWASLALPLLAGLRGGLRTSSRVAVWVWAFLLASANTIALILALRGRNNHWLTYLTTLLEGLAILLALIGWQVHRAGRLVLWVLLPIYLVTWTFIVFSVESLSTYSPFAGPFSSLLLLIALSATFVSRTMRSLEPLTRQDWFWVCLGLLIFYGVEAGYPPVALRLGASRPDLLLAASQARSAIMIVAMITVSWGLLCPTTRPQSGGSSSPSASPSLSSSSLSG
jgi:hypothetical protein